MRLNKSIPQNADKTARNDGKFPKSPSPSVEEVFDQTRQADELDALIVSEGERADETLAAMQAAQEQSGDEIEDLLREIHLAIYPNATFDEFKAKIVEASDGVPFRCARCHRALIGNKARPITVCGQCRREKRPATDVEISKAVQELALALMDAAPGLFGREALKLAARSVKGDIARGGFDDWESRLPHLSTITDARRLVEARRFKEHGALIEKVYKDACNQLAKVELPFEILAAWHDANGRAPRAVGG